MTTWIEISTASEQEGEVLKDKLKEFADILNANIDVCEDIDGKFSVTFVFESSDLISVSIES